MKVVLLYLFKFLVCSVDDNEIIRYFDFWKLIFFLMMFIYVVVYILIYVSNVLYEFYFLVFKFNCEFKVYL